MQDEALNEILLPLRTQLAEQPYPENYRLCILAAAEFIETAAMSISEKDPGMSVIELLLVSAKVEELAEKYSVEAVDELRKTVEAPIVPLRP